MGRARRFFDIPLEPELAVALRDWDDKMFNMRQVWMNSARMIEPLADAKLMMCSQQSRRIYEDLRLQITTGELFIRMLRLHAEQHPVLAKDMAAEIMRQYSNIVVQYYFWTSDGDQREELLSDMMDEYQQAITAALGTDDCGCDSEATE